MSRPGPAGGDAPGGRVLHPLVDGFQDADSYDRGRPVYGRGTTDVLMDGLGLSAGDPVLELGAGTGQLSRALLAAQLEVTAVEPLGATRALLARAIGAERVREGVAEEIPMPDGSVAAVLAADSFHWFDESLAMGEIHRVLRPAGGVGILRSFPIMDAPWADELGRTLEAARAEAREHPAFAGRGAAAALEEDARFGEVTDTVVESERVVDREGIVAYVGSISWVATLPAERREGILADARELLERNAVTELRHAVRHEVWMARLRA